MRLLASASVAAIVQMHAIRNPTFQSNPNVCGSHRETELQAAERRFNLCASLDTSECGWYHQRRCWPPKIGVGVTQLFVWPSP